MGRIVLLCLWLCAHTGWTQEGNEIPNPQAGVSNNDIEKRAPLASGTYRSNHKPMFTDCDKYNPEVAEAQNRGTFVITVHAEDRDPPDTLGGKITYSIEGLPLGRPNFYINATTGDIYTNAMFDRDEPSRQKELYLTVKAVDDGRPQLADICTFKVTVTDINDNSPSFDQQEYHARVSEDHPENTEVMRVFAYDFDDGENSRLTYNLSNTNPSFDEHFRIDQKTGVVYLQKPLGYKKRNEKFFANVVVHDNGPHPNTASAEISITVVDSDKKRPRIVSYRDSIFIYENQTDYETPLVDLTAESNVADKSVAFELIKGKTIQTNKDGTFALSQINDTSAVITLARQLDYETVTEYQLTVRAVNKDFLDTTVAIIVKVGDVNDEIPTFIEFLKGSVVENDIAGAQAMTVRAIDKDGTSPNNKVTYELMTYKDQFAIDPDKGVITAKVPFDREQESLYYVMVQARDNAPSALFKERKPNSAYQTFAISIEDENDNKPLFTKSIYVVFNISESANTQENVIEVKALDKDTASYIVYSIIEGNVGDAFSIEETTGRIKVNKKLDFEKIESYNLTVRAFDGIFEDTAKVIVHIQDENDERPIFENYNKEIHFQEETTSQGQCLVMLKAYDPDIKDRKADQKIVYSVGDTYKSTIAVSKDGCVTLIKPLDRDLPNGAPSYQAYISADDNFGGPNSLSSFAEITIILEDINDNAPFLNLTEVVWTENQLPGKIVELSAIDYDSAENGNGPPFTFEIPLSASLELTEKFEIFGATLRAKVTFDREEKKFYDLPIRITDSGKPEPLSAVSTLRIIIGDVNDNPAQDGSSEIFVYKYQDLNMDIDIGRIYVNDPDDWDLPDKIFQPEGIWDDNFEIGTGGMIRMRKGAPPNVYKLNFIVTEEHLPEIPRHQVKADVTVTVKDITEEAVRKSGSIRLKGATIGEFVERESTNLESKKDILQRYISRILNTSLENVDVFTVLESPSNSSFVDVRFSAHGSPYYLPEKLNNKVTELQDELERDLGVEFVMVSINECLQSACPANTSCTSVLSIKEEPAVVFTNKTSFVGVRAVSEADCECRERKVAECFNGGTPIEDGTCSCLDEFKGPNCEILGVSFTGDGWAMYPSFDSCIRNVISLNVLSQADDGLIFYVGPLTARQAALSHDFISTELRDGFVVLKIDLGSGPVEVISKYKKINDGEMHKIKINYTAWDVQIEVDECPSDCLEWREFEKDKAGLLNTNGPLQVGGRSTIFPDEEAKQVWVNPPSSQGFKGCITNFTYNSYVYNLGAPSDNHSAHATCNYGLFQAATFGIDRNFLVAILVCLAILLLLLLAVVVHKRKQDNLNEKDDDEIRDSIINPRGDDGGGQSDAPYDLTLLRIPVEKPPIKNTLLKEENDVPADIGSFLDDKKRNCDKDCLPYDDVRHYGYEGDGNSSGSLSSLASCTDEGDLKFNYLSSFGPRFRKLADMYGDDASEEGSQNGREEESWC